MKENTITLTDEVIMTKIYIIRGQRVMLDEDLAELYGVESTSLLFSSENFKLVCTSRTN